METFKKLLKKVARWLGAVFTPIRKNAAFFVFMYVLGYMCILWGPQYPSSAGHLELFLDLYIICLLLAVTPWRIRRWIRAVLYVVFYTTSVVDMYCMVKFGSSFSPTMLLLISETTGQEAAEFLKAYLSFDLLTTRLGWVLLLLLVHIIYSFVMLWIRGRHYHPRIPHVNLLKIRSAVLPVMGVLTILLFNYSIDERLQNKKSFVRLMSYKTIGQVEREFVNTDKVELYLPIYRFVFSIFSNELAAAQIDRLKQSVGSDKVDSCSYSAPNIVLVIGESYNRHHSQLYGYDRPTTPRQMERLRKDHFAVFSDVVAPYNLTSFVFKNMLSLQTVGDSADWCDYPLFPEVFRKAGYRVTFITNQFQTRSNEAIYDFSGGFFLNNPDLSEAMFDVRNDRVYAYDTGVLRDYDRLLEQQHFTFDTPDDHNLVILHLMGQHVNYRSRSPKDRKHFKHTDYAISNLTPKERNVIAEYDNATLFNDSIVDQIITRFEDKDALVIYLSDHGDECFGMGHRKFGRIHSDEIDYAIAHEEYEIPFWIWASQRFVKQHGELWKQIWDAKDLPFMTDCLPHLLLYLGGISVDSYRAVYNPLSPDYNAQRPRLLKGHTDYDKLRNEYLQAHPNDKP